MEAPAFRGADGKRSKIFARDNPLKSDLLHTLFSSAEHCDIELALSSA